MLYNIADFFECSVFEFLPESLEEVKQDGGENVNQ